MAVDKVWVFAESRRTERSTTATLELLTKARELGDTVEAVYAGKNPTDAVAAPVGEHGATKVYAVDPGDGLPGSGRGGRDRRRWRRPSIARRRSSSRRATTAATRSPACR